VKPERKRERERERERDGEKEADERKEAALDVYIRASDIIISVIAVV